MKRILLVGALLVVSLQVAQSKNLKARFAYSTFYSPEKGPYVETYLSVEGKSVNYVPAKEGKTQAAIEISMLFKQGEEVKFFDKYNLLSPEGTEGAFNLLDQQRVPLPNGNYNMELSIRDKNSDAKPYTLTQNIKLEFYANIVAVSDIELLSNYEKAKDNDDVLNRNGFKLIPFVDNFYGDQTNNLKFYTEIYNTSALLNNDSYLLTYHIETYEGKKMVENYKRFSKQQARPVNVLLTEYDIKDLPSGNYNLVVEVRNRNNELLATRESFFQRSKNVPVSESEFVDFKTLDIANTFAASITDKDILADNIRSLRPIAGIMENNFIDNQLTLADVKMMQQFLYDFWQRRNPENPTNGWMAYQTEVEKVNTKYSQPKRKGYDTDPGRVYLQYGPPNAISENYNEPNTYPYEIWQYYKVKNQSNRKFVFYNPDLVSKGFTLLHSDALGEPNDPQWQMRLYKRTVQNTDFDKEKVNQGYGQHSNDVFVNPH